LCDTGCGYGLGMWGWGYMRMAIVDGDFKQQLKKYSITPILIGIKHPQTNGKLERFFGEYKRHRPAFSSSKSLLV
jgi:transposase InsO family protein